MASGATLLPNGSDPLFGGPAREPRPRQRPRALAPGAAGSGRRRDGHLGRRRRFGAEDVGLALTVQQRLELLALDRLALDQDLRQLLQSRLMLGEDALGLDVRRLHHAPDLVVDLPRDLV